jgi:hypothetical protein
MGGEYMKIRVKKWSMLALVSLVMFAGVYGTIKGTVSFKEIVALVGTPFGFYFGRGMMKDDNLIK